jgi:8-oxo-dGTP diphosphatase/2-hydroxy-dATP diphosphatase
MKKVLTLVLIEREGKLLLGMKKRGFGEGRWNGFGGKLEGTETIEEAAKREVLEEVEIEVNKLEQAGLLTFSFESDQDLLLEVHVFKTDTFSGEPVETEEMKPEWFLHEDIPYSEMWPDDEFWLPKVLAGKFVQGTFHFDAPASLNHQATILSYKITEVEDLKIK